jgi:hypothetical protein
MRGIVALRLWRPGKKSAACATLEKVHLVRMLRDVRVFRLELSPRPSGCKYCFASSGSNVSDREGEFAQGFPDNREIPELAWVCENAAE